MDSTIIDWVPGLPKGMRLKDFPSFIRTTDPDDAMLTLTLHSTECQRSVPSAVVFHTFEELESQVIRAMSDILPLIYAMGLPPLLLREACAIVGNDHAASTSAASSLSKEDHACQVWLDGKRPNSVVFTIFGSLVRLTSEQLAELDWVLASSGYEFLRVIRSDQQAMGATGATTIILPLQFLVETEGQGRMTSWCLQEAVLWHKALGAFLTHCRWNSMLESVCAGVPMLCWPFGADQQTNSRSSAWTPGGRRWRRRYGR